MMIAPIPRSDPSPSRPGRAWQEARRWVASTFLAERAGAGRAKPVAPWKAWLFTLWAVIVTLAYLAHLVGIVL